AEVVPAPGRRRAAVVQELDAGSLLAASDLVEAGRLGDGGQELVVLAEAEIVEVGLRRERHVLEVDHEPAARTSGDVAGVGGEPVGEVEHRRRARGEHAAFLQAERRPDVALLAERRTGCTERAGDDESIARPGAAAAREARGTA